MMSKPHRLWIIIGVITGVLVLCSAVEAKTLYVSMETGKNNHPGTLEQPFKNIDKAIKMATAGDTIKVAGGIYMGTFNIGYLEISTSVKLYGSYAADFSTRDIRRYTTVFQPDNQSGAKSRKPLLRFVRNLDGVVVDGFVFDMGMRNAYHSTEGKPPGVASGRLLLPPKKMSGQMATVTEPCISIPGSAAASGTIVIQNNVFINAAKFAIQAGLRKGELKILNNVFVANRMAAIEVFGTCRSTGGPGTMAKCGSVEIAYNTILFSWSRLKDMQDMGYGIRIMTRLAYNIHHNIIGGQVLAAVDHTRFTPDEWIRLDHNIFFVNKQADLEFSPASNTKLNLRVEQFGDLSFASVQDNQDRIPKTLPVDEAYLKGFLQARYSETTDYSPDSPANQWREILGLNKQGKLKSTATMFANRYPLKQALKLFAAVKGYGAQQFE